MSYGPPPDHRPRRPWTAGIQFVPWVWIAVVLIVVTVVIIAKQHDAMAERSKRTGYSDVTPTYGNRNPFDIG